MIRFSMAADFEEHGEVYIRPMTRRGYYVTMLKVYRHGIGLNVKIWYAQWGGRIEPKGWWYVTGRQATTVAEYLFERVRDPILGESLRLFIALRLRLQAKKPPAADQRGGRGRPLAITEYERKRRELLYDSWRELKQVRKEHDSIRDLSH